MMRLELQMRWIQLRIDARPVILSISVLLGVGCAGFSPPAGDPATANHPTVTRFAAREACQWITLTRAGRAALSDGELARADRAFRSAIACTEQLSRRDARVRTSLGHLVTVAAAYHLAGDEATATDTMQGAREAAESRGLNGSVSETLDLRFEELTAVKQRLSLYPPRSRGSGAANRRGFDRMILSAAERFDVDPALVKAVVAAESDFDARAVSPVGAQGLMQLMPETARAMGVRWPFDPRENLKGGVRYLRAMLDRFGDTKHALAAYNAGPEAVVRHGGIPPYRETQDYVKRVLRFYASYRAESLVPTRTGSGS